MRKAKVAVARKFAVVLQRMLTDGTDFLADKPAGALGRRSPTERVYPNEPSGKTLKPVLFA